MLPSCPIFSMSWGKKATIALQAQTLLGALPLEKLLTSPKGQVCPDQWKD